MRGGKMKKIKLSLLVLFLLTIFTKGAFAQCPDPESIIAPPTLRGVVVKSSISLNKQTGIYKYSHSVKNGVNSDITACIRRFEIDITFPKGGVSLSKEGLVDYPRYVSKKAMSDPEAVSVIPVAFPDLPRRVFPNIGEITIWDAGITWYGSAAWSSALYPVVDTKIAPGKELAGFIMTSYGLPAIKIYKAEPHYIGDDKDLDKFIKGLSEAERLKYAGEYIQAFYDSIAWKGMTIGPTAPSSDFKPLDFINYIINMKHEAFSLGWITNKGIENSLDAKLDNAKKKIEQGNITAAKNILEAFINEVEAQGCETYQTCPSGKHLTPEAYALLKYNVQYLIGRL
jgi:hypothetical protein